jgi:hypothetical protein
MNTTRLRIRVPNERDDSGTVKVGVDFPRTVAGVSTQPVPGWTAKIAVATLDTPITSGDTMITREVRWTGPAGSDHPAPRVGIASGADDAGAGASTDDGGVTS